MDHHETRLRKHCKSTSSKTISFVKSLFMKEKSGKLAARKDLESCLISQKNKHTQAASCHPLCHKYIHQNINCISALVEGPTWNVPYRLHRNAPDHFLWMLMKLLCQEQAIPTDWQRAGGILISVDISQFRQHQWLAVFLEKKCYIDTTVQKVRIPVCLEHTNRIWHQIQAAKKNGRDLHIVFLDLASGISGITDPHQTLLPGYSAA